MTSLEKLFDRYERKESQGKDVSKTIKAIAFHKDIVMYIINEPTNRLIHNIGVYALDLTQDVWDKVEFLLLVNSLLEIYLGNSVKSITDKDKNRICIILSSIYNSEYKITEQESSLLDETLGLTKQVEKREKMVCEFDKGSKGTKSEKRCTTEKNKSKKLLSDLRVGDVVERVISDKLSVVGIIKGIEKGKILCEYICGELVLTDYFDILDGRLLTDIGTKVDLGHIALQN